MAKPNKKGPTKTVDVLCAGCKTPLFKYRKGGKGSLVKGYTQTTSRCRVQREFIGF